MPSHLFMRQPMTAVVVIPDPTTVFVSHGQPASHPAAGVFHMFAGDPARQ